MVVLTRMVAQLPCLTLLLHLLASVSSSTNSQLRRNKSHTNGQSYHSLSSEYSSSHLQPFSNTKSSLDYSLPIIDPFISQIKSNLTGTDRSALFPNNSKARKGQQEQDSFDASRRRVPKHQNGSRRAYLKQYSPNRTWRQFETADANIHDIFQPDQQHKLKDTLGTRLLKQAATSQHPQTHSSSVTPVGGWSSSSGRRKANAGDSGDGARATELWDKGHEDQKSNQSNSEQLPKIETAVESVLALALLKPIFPSSVTKENQFPTFTASDYIHSSTKSEGKYSPTASVLLPTRITTSPESTLSAFSSQNNSISNRRRVINDRDNSRTSTVPSNSLRDRNEATRVDEDKLLSEKEDSKVISGDNQIINIFTYVHNQDTCLHCARKHSINVVEDVGNIDINKIVDGSHKSENIEHRKHFRSFSDPINVDGNVAEPGSSTPDPHNFPSSWNGIKSKRKRRKSRVKREGNDLNDDSDSLTSAASSIKFQTEEEDDRSGTVSSDTTASGPSDIGASQNIGNRTTSTTGGATYGGTKTDGGGIVKEKIPQNEEELLVDDRHKLKVLLTQIGTECLQQMRLDDAEHIGCPRVWDTALCWPPTAPGQSATQPCPTHIPGMGNEGVAKRWCDLHGVWGQKPVKPTTASSRVQSTPATSESAITTVTPASGGDQVVRDETVTVAAGGGGEGSGTITSPLPVGGSNETVPMNVSVINAAGWTDYGQCLHVVRQDEEEGLSLMKAWLPFVKQCSLVGYSISLTTLLVSFVILASLKKLRCPRNLLHLHLFASFILRAVVVLLRSSLLASSLLTPTPTHAPKPTQINESDSWWCRLVIAIWQYFITANYSWILMEGLYLHNLIFRALFTDSSAITLYVLLGWGLPLGLVTAWACVRLMVDNSHCWMVHNKPWVFMVLIRIPVAFSVFLNFFFFVNVVRVLTLKLRSSVSDESMKYRKLAKSTLVLVPLFGAHYCLLWGLSTSTHPTVELAWLLVDQVFASFQGFFVAVLYCLMNGEVRQELKKIYYNRFGGGNHVPFATGQSTVMSHTRVYTSRTTRASLHSIQSMTERRERQSPSPKLTVRRDDDRGGGDPSPRFTPSPDPQKMAGFNSVTEEMIELHPRNTSTNPLGDSPEGQRKMTAFIEGANQDELQRLIPNPASELQNNLHFSKAVDLPGTGNCISGSNNFNKLEEGIGGGISMNLVDGGIKASSVKCVRNGGSSNSLGFSKNITRNGKVGNAISKDMSCKLEDTEFPGDNLEDSMTVNLMIDTGEVGMQKIGSGAMDVLQKKDEGGTHEPLISFDEVSAPMLGDVIPNEGEATSNGSDNTNFEVDPLGGHIVNDNSQNKTMNEKGLKVNYTKNIKGSKVSTLLHNTSPQDDSTEDSKSLIKSKDKRHETML